MDPLILVLVATGIAAGLALLYFPPTDPRYRGCYGGAAIVLLPILGFFVWLLWELACGLSSGTFMGCS